MSVVTKSWEPSESHTLREQPALVRSFELLTSARGGVAKLRELILGLAARGKLVAQDQRDESASELLKRIEANRVQLVRSKQLRGRKALPPISDDEHMFPLPTGWAWTRLGDAGDWGAGATPSRAKGEYYGGDIPWFKSGELTTDFVSQSEETVTTLALRECSLRANRTGDVLIAMYGATIGKTAILSREGTTNQAVCACTPFEGLDNRFLLLVLKALRPYFVGIGAGGAQPNISREKIVSTVVGLPPLAEQHRIVARVENLMKLCDALEQSGQLADERHARLTTTLLDALASSESAHALAENWQRVAKHFDLLLDRPESIDAVEQTIFQLAVRGLLVPQEAGDEPAMTLLQRLRFRQPPNKGKRLPQIPTVDGIAAPYDLPGTWSWALLDELVENMGSGWSPACDEGERSEPNRWAVLRTTSVQVMEYRPREHKAIPLKLNARPEIEVRSGDILITRAGPMNRVGISCWVDETLPRLMLSDKIVRFHPIEAEMLPAFIVLALNAGWTKDQLEAAKTGMAASQVNISQSDLRRMVLPVCSKSEQRRIVARVEELRRLCADLRQRLTQAREVQSRLADALVAEVA